MSVAVAASVPVEVAATLPDKVAVKAAILSRDA